MSKSRGERFMENDKATNERILDTSAPINSVKKALFLEADAVMRGLANDESDLFLSRTNDIARALPSVSIQDCVAEAEQNECMGRAATLQRQLHFREYFLDKEEYCRAAAVKKLAQLPGGNHDLVTQATLLGELVTSRNPDNSAECNFGHKILRDSAKLQKLQP